MPSKKSVRKTVQVTYFGYSSFIFVYLGIRSCFLHLCEFFMDLIGFSGSFYITKEGAYQGQGMC